jgi:hypothetical protein
LRIRGTAALSTAFRKSQQIFTQLKQTLAKSIEVTIKYNSRKGENITRQLNKETMTLQHQVVSICTASGHYMYCQFNIQ